MMKPPNARAGLGLCAVLSLLLSGCSTVDKPKPAPVQAVIQSPGKATVTVSDADGGALIVLERSQELVVRLAITGSGNADWAPVDLKPGVLRVVSGPIFERKLLNAADDPMDGSTVWRLRAESPGSLTLQFDLRRRYSLGPSARSLSFPVTVKQGSAGAAIHE